MVSSQSGKLVSTSGLGQERKNVLEENCFSRVYSLSCCPYVVSICQFVHPSFHLFVYHVFFSSSTHLSVHSSVTSPSVFHSPVRLSI